MPKNQEKLFNETIEITVNFPLAVIRTEKKC